MVLRRVQLFKYLDSSVTVDHPFLKIDFTKRRDEFIYHSCLYFIESTKVQKRVILINFVE